MDIKGEIHINTLIEGVFNIPLTSMNRSSRQEINEEIVASTVTLSQINLIDIYKTFHPQTAEYTFFQVYMEHSPEQITY